ncbi:hypothetical protein DQ04_00351080 [Trypanosoma grayi]|uniref:hypothetical protein n=1 Tax=Trypanosoma grayi TaxID=71804 RepID=UPI0004F40510|nr:hypothetical protein DQ04_00351080 [Trypanosoma grayi]KEG14671.1 hypothetical protein DQ04_00351080 [Trypanosoma grayi]
MISLKFTLYRFVCDVTTFAGLFASDADGRRIPDNASFACHWSRVPRTRTASPSEPSGCTPASYFRAQGSDMTLSFNSASGALDLDGDADVIAFMMKPSNCVGGAVPVVAKGTLDPLPYLGKPSKNYAIKLRDAAGQVIGKLLFAMEAREAGEEERLRENDRGRDTATFNAVPLNRYAPPSLPTQRGQIDSSSHNSNKSNNDNNNNNGIQSHTRRHGSKEKSQSPPDTATTQRNSLESSLSRNVNNTDAKTPAPASAPDVGKSLDRSSEHLEIDFEKISIKNEAIDLDNPAPLLLGGMYYIKVRYGSTTSRTPIVECQNPKEISYFHSVTFKEIQGGSERLRFSLWENERQVAGFSLDPAKFRVAPGARKEYSIPFRYYPTQQAASLEVTVRRTGAANAEVKQEAVPNLDNMTQAKENLQPPSVQSRGTMNYHEEEYKTVTASAAATKEPVQSALASSVREERASSQLSSSTRYAGQQRINAAKEYVQKRYFDPNVRQSHWDGAMQRKDDVNSQSIQQQQQQEQQQQQQPLQRDDAEVHRGVSTPPPGPASSGEQQSRRTDDGATSYAEQSERNENAENVSQTQTFLEQIAQRNSRSSSATRRPTKGLDVPQLVPHRREPPSRTFSTPDSMYGDRRSSTPLRSHNNVHRSSSLKRRGERIQPDGASDVGLSRDRSSWRRPSSLNGSFYERMSDRASLSGFADGREQLADSLLSRLERRPGFRTSLMEEWLEWRGQRTSARASRAGSVQSAFSRDDSVDSITSRNRAASPLPTKTVADAAEQKPYQPQYIRRSSSTGPAATGRPPMPMR